MPELGAFVMARGGSVGIPGKNIKPLVGMPMIAHTLLAAQACKSIGRIFLSTDSESIAAVGRDYGVEVPFIRPPELARADSPGIEALLHAVKWVMENLDYKPEFVLELLPTSPLRSTEDIEQAMAIMIEKNADSVVSVTEAAQHPYWARKIDSDGRLAPFFNSPYSCSRRQDLPPAYALHGAIKIARLNVLLEYGNWYTENTFAYLMPPERSLDVDTPWDLRLAEMILTDNLAKTKGSTRENGK